MRERAKERENEHGAGIAGVRASVLECSCELACARAPFCLVANLHKTKPDHTIF